MTILHQGCVKREIRPRFSQEKRTWTQSSDISVEEIREVLNSTTVALYHCTMFLFLILTLGSGGEAGVGVGSGP